MGADHVLGRKGSERGRKGSERAGTDLARGAGESVEGGRGSEGQGLDWASKGCFVGSGTAGRLTVATPTQPSFF